MKRTPIAERLRRQVTVRGADECWPWTGATNKHGYGQIGVGGRGEGMIGVHRAAYEAVHGSAAGIHVRHTCDNPPCCNPAHLIPGTHDDNMRDMAERERSGKTKLTAAQVAEIRDRASEPHKVIAAEFGISKSNVSMIVTRQTWQHLPACLLDGAGADGPVLVVDPMTVVTA